MARASIGCERTFRQIFNDFNNLIIPKSERSIYVLHVHKNNKIKIQVEHSDLWKCMFLKNNFIVKKSNCNRNSDFIIYDNESNQNDQQLVKKCFTKLIYNYYNYQNKQYDLK